MSSEKGWDLPPIVRVRGKYRYAELEAQCVQLLQRYDFLTREQIGTSVLGKPIYALILGKGPERLHMNAAVHANEWITAPLLLRFIEEMSESVQTPVKGLGADMAEGLDKYTVWAVPMVNPDGVNLSQDGIPRDCPFAEKLLEWNGGSGDFSRWKANVRGVDLNDQFPAYWEVEQSRRGADGPASQDFGGLEPLSEPEAAALAELTRYRQFDKVLSLHTQGKEIYWNYRGMEPPEAEALALRMAAAGAGGYRAVKLTGSDAGFKDWFIHEFRRPGFTVEAGEGVNPLPAERFDFIYEELKPVLAQFIRE